MAKTYKIKSDVDGVVSVGLFAGQRPDGTTFETFQIFSAGEEINNISPRVAKEVDEGGSAARFIEGSGSSSSRSSSSQDNPFVEGSDEPSKEELQDEAESLGLAKSGTKDELRERIAAHHAERS